MGSTLYSKRFVWTEGRNRKKRPKTFKTEQAAKKWAEANKISSYELVNLHSSSKDQKIRVIAKS
jgi:hypothetical protein